MLSKRVLVCLAAILASSAAGKNYENKLFHLTTPKAAVKVAIIPIINENAEILDTSFAIMYGLDTGKVSLLGPKALRERIRQDSALGRILDTIGRFQYNGEQRKGGPTLGQVVSPSDVSYLLRSLDSADFLLFPIRFGTKDLGIVTAGVLNLRLYSLQSDSLIYEREQSINVNQSGDQGRKSLIIGIVAFSWDDFNKYFLKKAGLRD